MKKRTLIAAAPIVLSSLAYGGEVGAQTLDIQAPNATGAGITFSGLINHQGDYVVSAQGDHINGSHFVSPLIGFDKNKDCHGQLCAVNKKHEGGDLTNYVVTITLPHQFRFDRPECMQAQFEGWADPFAAGALMEPEVKAASDGRYLLKLKLPRIVTEQPPEFAGELYFGNDNERCLPQKDWYLKVVVSQKANGDRVPTSDQFSYVKSGRPMHGGTLQTSDNQYVTKTAGDHSLYVDPTTITITHTVPWVCARSKLVGQTRIPNETTLNGGFVSATLSGGGVLLFKFPDC